MGASGDSVTENTPAQPEPLPGNREQARVRWFCRPPPAWVILLAIAVTGWALYVRSAPLAVVGGLLGCLAVPLVLIIAVDYAIRVVRCAAGRVLGWHCWRWYAVPLLAALSVWSWQTSWPLRIRFAQSRPAFERAAVELLANSPSTRPYVDTFALEFRPYDSKLGSYEIPMVAVFPEDRLVFFMTSGFFRRGGGFVYNPDGRALEVGERQRAGGDWVRFRSLAPQWMTFIWSEP